MLHRRKVDLYHEIPPRGIIERVSTDVVVAENPVVVKASRMIREGISTGLSVKELCSKVSISRSKLDQLFQISLGRTVSEEIHRFRLLLCSDLLVTTDVKINEIAARCGFSSPNHLTRFFKRETGMAPTEFRASGKKLPRR
jgi:LacI family transcriptional regulator